MSLLLRRFKSTLPPLLAAIAVTSLAPGRLPAQASGIGYAQCGTTTTQDPVQCATGGNAASVRLIRDLTESRCRKGSTWTNTAAVIRTSKGCRGEFEITFGTGSVDPGFGVTPTRRIACGTSSGAQVTCKTEGYATAVRLVRDLSGNKCKKGSNWGNTDSFIWANSGCRGEFEVTYRDTTPPGSTRIIACGTNSGAQVTCKTEGYATAVRLVRDLSGNKCRKGTNWGNTDSFIWANKGCRGEFEVTYRTASTAPVAGTERIRCGNGSPFKVECKTGELLTGLRLVRDIAEAKCRPLSSWGYEGSTVWTTKGCQGDFEVTHREPSPTPLPGPAPQTRVIACGNSSGATMSCNAFGKVASARLMRDRSGSKCRKGSTWNHDEGNIWVQQGCWGDFEVTYAGVPQPR